MGVRDRGGDETSEGGAPVAPGALTELLRELARAPEGAGWESPPRPGEVIGRFEIQREVGRGGFGVVYQALDRELGRAVAFKALRGSGAAGEGPEAARAAAEAEAAARLAHPNIVHLYDLGRGARGAYLIMELLRGRSLADQLAAGPLPLREAVRVAVELARGLAHAHGQGVVHRDLKPSNVYLCEDGQVKVLDFGLAQVFGKAGLQGGTPGYMAPEQARGEPGDARADVYALGQVLRELLTGRGPKALTPTELASAERPLPAGTDWDAVVKGVPSALVKLVARFTAAEPADRPADAGAALASLRPIEESLRPKRLLWASWALAAVALLVAGGLALWYRPLPPGRLLTALADVDNQTGDRDLDGVGELLRAGLEQSKRLSLMARSRLVNALREAGRPIPASFGEQEARPAAERMQAQLLVVPSVRLSEGGYEVAVKAVDLGRGEHHFTLSGRALTKDSVPGALDHLVARVMKRLKEAPGQAPQAPVAVADLAPAHPEALRHHAEGRRLASEGRVVEAMRSYRKAIDLDPAFLLPRIAAEASNQNYEVFAWDFDAGFPDLQANRKVLQSNLHRMAGSDRAFMEAVLEPFPSAPEQVAALDRVIEAWPEDPRAWVLAGQQLMWERADLVAARPYLERAIALAPLAETHAIEFLLFLGRYDEAVTRARRWTEAAPAARSFRWLAEAHRHRGEVAPALQAARQALALPDPLLNAAVFLDADALDEVERFLATQNGGRSRWYAARGRVREALALHQLPKNPAWFDRLGHHVGRAQMHLPSGDVEALMRELEGMLRAGSTVYHCETWALALMGDLDRAESLAFYGASDARQVCAGITLAIVDWKRGDPERALRALARYQLAVADYYRGEIFAGQGRHREAVERFRQYRLHRGLQFYEGFYDWWNFPRSLYLEAVSLEALGEREAARALVGRLLHLWERADPGYPLLAEARALERRLSAPR